MTMKDPIKIQKVDEARQNFIAKDYPFYEHANGHFTIHNTEFWATTGNWYNTVTKEGGKGINKFMNFLDKRIRR